MPESGAVLAAPPRDVELDFDEVVSERIVAPQPTLAGAVLVSPAAKPVSVDWHRRHITISIKGGFAAGRVYRVELLPVITDLRQNRMKKGRTIVFTTGPAVPSATLAGTIVDWTGNRTAAGALVRAVLLPDSLPYLGLADSVGDFRLQQMPPGEYLVYGVVDQNNNRKLDAREAFDTARVTLGDSASLQLYAFTHDTVGPRVRSADVLDSVTLRLTFDRPLSSDSAVDSSMVHVSPVADSTRFLPLQRVYLPAVFDSMTRVEATARAAAQAAKDSAARVEAAAKDSAARAAAPKDTTHPQVARPPAARPAPTAPGQARQAGPPPLGAAPRGGRRDTTATRRDSTRASKMLARRPAPSDQRVIRMEAPLEAGGRYYVTTQGVHGLTGIAGVRVHTTVVVPKPKPPDTTRARGDTTRSRGAGARGQAAPGAARTDTLRAAPPDTARARRDSVPPPADTARARRDSMPADTTRPRRDTVPLPRPPRPALRRA